MEPGGPLPFVRVVVLNWNQAWLTSRCLHSLAETEYPTDRHEVVVVDNGSIDGSLARLRHDFGHLRFVENGANLGFAEGCNRAMRDLDGVDAVALVNNDSTVERDWLRLLVDELISDDRIGAVCPKILLATPSQQGETLINSVGLHLTQQSEGMENRRGEPDEDGLPVAEVDAFSGGGVLMRSAALAEVGLFDPRFFAYCEDVDLSWRMRRRGWRIVCQPAAVIHHVLGGSAAHSSPFFFHVYFRNWLLMVLRNGSWTEIYRAKRNALGRTWSTRQRRWRQWPRVWAAVVAGLPGVVSSRAGWRRVGERPVDDVMGRLMPRPAVPRPKVRGQGQVLVYLDVTDIVEATDQPGTLGDRIERRLLRELPSLRHEVELVPVVTGTSSRLRRVSSAEYAALLAGVEVPRPDAALVAALGLDELEAGALFIGRFGEGRPPLHDRITTIGLDGSTTTADVAAAVVAAGPVPELG